MLSRLQQLWEGAVRRLWDEDLGSSGPGRALAVRSLRIAHCVVRDLASGEITLHTMSLVYTSLLSLVPLLAVSFSVLKAFGVHRKEGAEPILLNFLGPLGERGVELTGEIIDWVENMEVGLLGGLGLAFLIYSVVSLIQKLENAVNSTWHITQRLKLAKRLGDYLSVILIGPVLIFAALGIIHRASQAASGFLSWGPLDPVLRFGGRAMPYLLAIAAFTLVYLYVPNTRVRLRSAFAGAAVAGVLWQTSGWLFTSVVVSSARYSAFYSGFAVVLLFMIWLYLNWLLLLLGASIAFYHQNPDYLGLDPGSLHLSGRLREKLALRIVYLIGKRHYERGARWSVEGLAQQLRLPSEAVARVLDALEGRGLLAVAGEDDNEYLPARAIETVRLEEVLDAVRSSDEGALLNPARLPPDPTTDALEQQLQAAWNDALGQRTVRDLVLEERSGATVSGGEG